MNRRRVGEQRAPREVHLLELLASAEVLRGAVRQGLALLEVHALEVLAYGGADFLFKHFRNQIRVQVQTSHSRQYQNRSWCWKIHFETPFELYTMIYGMIKNI